MTEYVFPANRLIHERSPYLLQHAHNPVDWYPWGSEAFERAIREQKPIFLSIGYSSCHWCHVMAHESFENHEVARILNQNFISIKVDREERPDIDQVYMMVCQVMTGQGGWPLTIVMTPERKPFFAATYLPRQTRNGMPGLIDILPRLMEAWRTRAEDIQAIASEVIQAVHAERSEVPGRDPSLSILEKAYNTLDHAFDQRFGGFGTSPKFPSPHHLLFLLRIWYRGKDSHALSLVEKTLQEMRKGGIFDHVGFGFHRYAVDKQWVVPHFEKMLYDQAFLAIAYLEAFQVTRDPQYARTANEIFTYVLRDLTSESGGFYAAEDADSEGSEGKFYLWTWEELEHVLEPEELTLLSRTYSLQKEGNLPLPIQGAPSNGNILHRERSWEDIAKDYGIGLIELEERIERVGATLLRIRSGRVRPAKDTKILADWNGFMIAALAFGGRVLGEVQYTEAAERAEHYILKTMQRADGRLNHVYTAGERYIDAFSDDYAAIAWGEIELYETTFNPQHLQRAIQLMDKLIAWYSDTENGGYYFTSSDSESLILRRKEAYDGAVPSDNSLALYNLVRLASLIGNAQYEERALRDWKTFSETVETAPQGFTFLLLSADLLLSPRQEVVISGDPALSDTHGMLRAIASSFFPHMTVLLLSGGSSDVLLGDLSPSVRRYPLIKEKSTAYVCVNRRCLPPTSEIEQMIGYISLST